jgi:hypothetical protein
VATIGELVVNLRTNSAQFNSGMEAAAEKTRKVGASARTTQEGLAKLAAKGFGELIPIGNRAENMLERVFKKMSEGAGIMGAAGKASIALGAGLLAFKLGERISEWLALGTSVENYTKRIADAKKEQDALVETLSKQRNASQSLDKELANLTGDFRKVIELDKASRDANILATFKPGAARSGALDKSAAIATEALRVELEKQAQAREKFAADALADLVKEREARFKTWQDETTIFAKNLQDRAKARQDFESQFGQGGFDFQSNAKGIREALDLQATIRKELRDVAFAKREGFLGETDVRTSLEDIATQARLAGQEIKDKFGASFPAVTDAVEKSLRSVDNLGSEFEKARGFIDSTVPTVGELTAGLSQFNGLLQAMPAATEAAQGAIAALANQYATLNAQIVATTQNAATLAQVLGQ